MLVNIHDAKTNFSKLINQVLNGEDIVIARGGVPLVRMMPYSNETEVRHGGQFKGLIEVNDDFNDPLPEDILKLFHGE